MDTDLLEKGFFAALLVLAIFLSWMVLSSYVGALILAGTLALIFRPVYHGLRSAVRFESLAAILTILAVVIIVFIPLGFFAVRLFVEANTLSGNLATNGGTDISYSINQYLHAIFPNLQLSVPLININTLTQQILAWLTVNLGSVFSSVTQVLFLAFLSLLGLFYFLKDGDGLKKWILGSLPLSPKYTERIVHETESALGSVVRGTLVIAVIQGIVIGLGFFLFGISNPVFWGALTVIVTLIPLVGTWLVVVPAIAYLFSTGHLAMAIGFAIWSIVLVNLIYNILSPQLMHRGIDIHPFIILLSVLGGIAAFGPIGFLIGPFIIALLFSLLRIYPELILKK